MYFQLESRRPGSWKQLARIPVDSIPAPRGRGRAGAGAQCWGSRPLSCASKATRRGHHSVLHRIIQGTVCAWPRMRPVGAKDGLNRKEPVPTMNHAPPACHASPRAGVQAGRPHGGSKRPPRIRDRLVRGRLAAARPLPRTER